MWPLCLASFTQHVFKVHPCCSMYQYFIPFCAWIIFYQMWIPHFTYPFVSDSHLGCFHFGETTFRYKLLYGHIFWFLLGKYLGVGIARLYGNCLTFWGTGKLFSKLVTSLIIFVQWGRYNFVPFLQSNWSVGKWNQLPKVLAIAVTEAGFEFSSYQ